ncbi:MAG: DinB family protein [bacterium]
MNDLNDILDSLKRTPSILESLVKSIPGEMLKVRRVPGKWSIHEHACHIVDVQPMLIERCKTFLREEHPEFSPYIPGKTVLTSHLIDMNLETALEKFREDRNDLLELVQDVDECFWLKEAVHPEYTKYTPQIMFRHILMHEHFHLYRIEELWLTTEDFLPEGKGGNEPKKQ